MSGPLILVAGYATLAAITAAWALAHVRHIGCAVRDRDLQLGAVRERAETGGW